MKRAVSLAVLLPGCYLVHGSDGIPAPPAVAPRCSTADVEGLFTPTFDPAPHADVVALAAGGCNQAFAVLGNDPSRWSYSDDGATTFRRGDLLDDRGEDPIVVPDPRGGAHLVYLRAGAVLHRLLASDGSAGAETMLGGRGAALLKTGPTARARHAVDARADGALATVWSEPRYGGFHIAFREPDGSVGEPMEIVTATSGQRVQEARLCWAGQHLVVAWERLSDCADAEIFGAVLNGRDPPRIVRLGDSVATCSRGGGLDVACARDGRALVGWAEAEGVFSDGRATIGVATFSEGEGLEPAESVPTQRWWRPSGIRLHAGATRALVTFGGLGYTAPYLVLSWDGRPIANRELEASDVDAERLDGRFGACGHRDRDDFFFAVFELRARRTRDRNVVTAVRLDPSGRPDAHARLMEYPHSLARPVNTIACTGAGTLLVDAARMVAWHPP